VATISSACSSLINALEIVEGYFAMGKSKQALVIASGHDTAFQRCNLAKKWPLMGRWGYLPFRNHRFLVVDIPQAQPSFDFNDLFRIVENAG
jgi:hypothetical protein